MSAQVAVAWRSPMGGVHVGVSWDVCFAGKTIVSYFSEAVGV